MKENLIVYYFSGTGNSLVASRWIRDSAIKKGIDTVIRSIETLQNTPVRIPDAKTLVGICFPTHGFCAPWIVIKFLLHIRGSKNTSVFFINTRAGIMAGRIIIPGLSGIATWLPMLILRLKGIKTRGVLPLDMPCNWTAIIPPNSGSASRKITEVCHVKSNIFSEMILSGRRYFSNNIWYTLPVDIILLPVSIAYLFAGRFFLGKLLFASPSCNTCRLCEKNCPVGAITIIGNRPYWKHNCENCQRCMNICPKTSIQAGTVWFTVIMGLLMLAGIWIWPFNYLIWLVLISIGIFPVYRLFHSICNIRRINSACTGTSMTKYWKRYIAEGITLKDLKE